jgi:predicted urease superfamily metal-dependent hydrolase
MHASFFKEAPMPNNSDCSIATADALTLLLHNQHALGAAIEEITKWLSENGVESVAAHAMSAMETLDTNAQAITNSIMRIRQL